MNLASRVHKNKTPALLLKLNISKVFDFIRWEFIMDLLQKRSFLSCFRNWIDALLNTSSLRVLLNGIAGNSILHGRGLRQGDPLSPLLFVLSIDPSPKSYKGQQDMGFLINFAAAVPSFGHQFTRMTWWSSSRPLKKTSNTSPRFSIALGRSPAYARTF
jgi:hypothetical protein